MDNKSVEQCQGGIGNVERDVSLGFSTLPDAQVILVPCSATFLHLCISTHAVGHYISCYIDIVVLQLSCESGVHHWTSYLNARYFLVPSKCVIKGNNSTQFAVHPCSVNVLNSDVFCSIHTMRRENIFRSTFESDHSPQ